MSVVGEKFRRFELGWWLLLVMILLGSCQVAAGRPGVHAGGLRLSPAVQSLAEIRWKNLVRQGWDISCGAAAVSTLLTYHHQRPFSETAITLTILKNSDPELVRQRGGFSLYDLKRFVRAIDLDGVGYGEMTLDDLVAFDLPAILPVRINDIDHFVIYRKMIGGHVILGDPAFGNISLSQARFNTLWRSKVAFYVVTKDEKRSMESQDSSLSKSPMTPEAMELAIPHLGYSSRVVGRIQSRPLARRATAVNR